jgi:hypothetical protein
MKTYWISLGHATFALTEEKGVVTTAAPIAHWALGKRIEQVLLFYSKKRAVIKVLDYDHMPKSTSTQMETK